MKKLIFFILLMPWQLFGQLKPEIFILLNENISTHVTVGEPIKFVDISTDNIIGDIPIDNILRLKPVVNDSTKMENGAIMAIVTIVTERRKIQLECSYTTNQESAFSNIDISDQDMNSYINPDIQMPQAEIYKYAWKVFNSKKKYFDVSKEQYKLRVTLNNIYTVNNHFFIDLSLLNKTNIQYDIDQIRFKIEDKKQTKATNFQQIEIDPITSLIHDKSFKKDYRNVFVFEKFSFPDEKVFTVEVAEKQISGRTVILKIDYSDILNADSFSKYLF